MDGEPNFNTETPEISKEEELRAEFNRPVPPENIPLIEKIRLHTQPGQTTSDRIGWDVFGVDTGHYGLSDEFKAALEKGDLTPKGQFYKKFVENRDFIELACGDPSWSPTPRAVAKALGARRYIGVDKYALADADKRMQGKLTTVVDKQSGYTLQNALGPAHVENEGGFEFSWIQDDMLGFVSKIKDTNGAVFFLAGVQEYETDDTSQDYQVALQYFDALGRELSRVTHNGDSVIFSGVRPVDELLDKIEQHGFRRMTKEELGQAGFQWETPTMFIKE